MDFGSAALGGQTKAEMKHVKDKLLSRIATVSLSPLLFFSLNVIQHIINCQLMKHQQRGEGLRLKSKTVCHS